MDDEEIAIEHRLTDDNTSLIRIKQQVDPSTSMVMAEIELEPKEAIAFALGIRQVYMEAGLLVPLHD